METPTEYLKVLITLLVIINPIGAIPVFAGLTQGQPDALRARTLRSATITVGTVLMVSVLMGEEVLRFFGVSLDSFRVGGGILLLMLAMAMLQAQPSRTKQTPEEEAEAESRSSAGIVPIGLPILAGPGAMSTAILYGNRARGWGDMAFLLFACLLMAAFCYLSLRLAGPIERWMGRTGINVLTRIMGILLAAIAVEFITRGLAQLLPGLAAAGSG